MYCKLIAKFIMLILLMLLVAVSIGFADSRESKGGHNGKGVGYHGAEHGQKEGHNAGETERGGEVAGVVAAIVFVVANATVVLSFARRVIVRFAITRTDLVKRLVKADAYQKRILFPFHYYLNIFGILIVFWHWYALSCEKSAIPELGAVLLILLGSFGLIIKFTKSKFIPNNFVKYIHKSPVSVAIIAAVLLAGHIVVD